MKSLASWEVELSAAELDVLRAARGEVAQSVMLADEATDALARAEGSLR